MANNPVDKFQIFVTQLHNAGYDYDEIIYCMSIASNDTEDEVCKELLKFRGTNLTKELMQQSLSYFDEKNIDPSIHLNKFVSVDSQVNCLLQPSSYMRL